MAICLKCKGVLNFQIRARTIRLQSDGDVMILASNQKRTEAYDGEWTLEDRNPRITATLVVPNDLYVKDIQELCDAPVVVELCDGRTFATEHASQVSEDGYNAKRNLQPIILICDRIEEMLPQVTAAQPPGIGAGFVTA
jgi:hypothetical protein